MYAVGSVVMPIGGFSVSVAIAFLGGWIARGRHGR